MNTQQPMREVFGKELVRLGRENENVVVLDADVSKSTKTTYFGEEFPERFFDVGIAEQNMVGIAAGAASCGMIPWVASFAFLLSQRALEQVRTSIAYPKLNVKLAGGYAGLSDSFDGATHQSVFDIAVMRALPNMKVVVPSDNNELPLLMDEIMQEESPMYLRLSRAAPPELPKVDVKIGSAITRIKYGHDAVVFATGRMVYESIQAADLLKRDSVNITVVEIHTIKPFDVDTVISSVAKTQLVVTAEEHNIIGGLGSAIAETLSEHSPRKIVRIGLNDTFAESGALDSLYAKYGLTAAKIRSAVLGKQ